MKPSFCRTHGGLDSTLPIKKRSIIRPQKADNLRINIAVNKLGGAEYDHATNTPADFKGRPGAGWLDDRRIAGIGTPGVGAGRNSSAVHGHSGEREFRAGGGPADIRPSQDRWPIHAEGPVLHDSTLRASGCRPRHLPIEGLWSC